MKYIIALICFFSVSVQAQIIKGFEIVKADTVFTIDSTLLKHLPQNLKFGGISGLDRTDEKDLVFVSDRRMPSPLDSLQDSWAYVVDSTAQIKNVFQFFGVKNVEAIRFDKKNNRIWYAYEGDSHTGMGFIGLDGKATDLETYKMFDNQITFNNKGIEGLATGNDLWYSFEAGRDSTLFVRWPNFEQNKAIKYKYQIDSRSCLSDAQILGGSMANGVTDILTFPETDDRLLVLERCFNGKYTNVRIYEAWIKGNHLEKREIFNWNPSTTFQNKAIKPDNIEGMVWGDVENGKRTLYIISDDNHNTRHQRTILLKLREI